MIRCAKKITQPLPAPSKLHGPACQQSNVGSKCDPFNWTNKRNTSRIAIFRHPCKPSIASSTSSGDNEKRTTKTMDGTVSLEIVQVEKTQSRQSNLRECLPSLATLTLHFTYFQALEFHARCCIEMYGCPLRRKSKAWQEKRRTRKVTVKW